jgi:hypothetical protein
MSREGIQMLLLLDNRALDVRITLDSTAGGLWRHDVIAH